MGTTIELKVGGVSVDYAKHNAGNDHGFLSQESDRTRRHSDQTDYEYCATHPEVNLSLRKESLVSTLSRVLIRQRVNQSTFEAINEHIDDPYLGILLTIRQEYRELNKPFKVDPDSYWFKLKLAIWRAKRYFRGEDD